MTHKLQKLIGLLAFSLPTLHATSQTLPSAALQAQMLAEEQAFLQNMKPTLQHEQMLAVRKAINGNAAALEQIRASRNKAPELPEGVSATYLRPDLCLFAPTKAAKRRRPLLLYLHGGGWCFGSINSCTRFCATLAREADCCVAALNYRLSPAYPFPTPLNDCRDAFRFLKQHAADWGCDTARVSVGGDSAGGNLALATAITERGVEKVVPIYPVTKLFTVRTASWQKYAAGYGNDAELLQAFNEAYAHGNERNPLVSVALADDATLKALPPALILSAGHDILFDQTAELTQRLQRLGNRVTYHVFPTATHLFITVAGQPTAFHEAVKTVGEFLNEE